jgi:hypothetical protein
MTLVLDAGALIALERHDRAMWRRLKAALVGHDVPVTHGGIVGQAWRGRGPQQALLATALSALDIHPLDERLGRGAGELLALARRRDVIDAALVLLARDGDHIATSDPDDIEPLARASGRHVEIVKV